MGRMKKILIWAAVCSFSCCRHKPQNAGEKEKPVDIKDFMGMFTPVKLPLAFGDSSLSKKPSDSSVRTSVLRQFIPDSIFIKHWGKSPKSKFYTAGKVAVRKAETYLFLKFMGTRRVLYVMGFDREGHFKAILPLVYGDEDPNISYSSVMDTRYTITLNRQRKQQFQNFYKKSVYVFNEDAAAFTLIMTESNEEKPKQAQVYNPIDTFSHKHKFTGDYVQDGRNFISVRDGRSNSVIRFFVHFEKEKGSCIGELKGEARMVSPTVARYSSNGDPCSLQFTFSEKNVRMKELEGCGNHRGIRCYFEGVYNKRKAAKVNRTSKKPGKRQ
ncbi:MAG TPA: hypothetical protein VGM24_06590 [Puia sp.]|jgi:hypothetical protein